MTFDVLVPSSLVREAEDKREATRKLGYVARAAAVFRADRLVVFPDRDGERRWGGGFVETILRYAATPPHLKTEAWGRRDELEYAGVLPPLRVSSRTGSGPKRPGSIQEGIVTEVGPDGRVRVNCGLQHPISLLTPDGLRVEEGERVAIRISSREPVRARIVDEPLPGFEVRRADLPDVLARPDAGVRIATSVHGTELSVDRLAALVGRIGDGDLTVAFGAPGRGLPAILDVAVEEIAAGGGESVDPDPGFDLWLNTIPRQGSETVRTEEAMFASLAPLTLTE
jgi:predicted SPOUT superfamily RNA methylase MTH1